MKAVPETVKGKNDGKIIGVDNTMEYRKDGETEYTSITGTSIPDLAPGTYYVRTKADDNHVASSDLELKVEGVDTQLTATFDSKGGSSVESASADFGKPISEPDPEPTKTGYKFSGWYTDGETFANDTKWNFSTGLEDNITLYANWTINQYTITFETGEGGLVVAPITQDYNSDVTAPADPTWIGHVFKGWDKEIPSKMPAEDVTITA